MAAQPDYAKIRNGDIIVLRDPLYFSKVRVGAQAPFKPEDCERCPFWNITLIGRDENRTEDVTGDNNTFTTGLSFNPPPGFHVEVFPDDSLVTMGYTLIPKIVSSQDRSELLLDLFKFKDADDLPLPFVGAKLIVRETAFVHLIEQHPKKSMDDSASVISQPVSRRRVEEQQGTSKRKGNKMF